MEQCGIEYVAIDAPSKHHHFDGDALLIQFPDQVFWRTPLGRGEFSKNSPLYLHMRRELKALARMKRRGVKLIWIVHNLAPHDLSLTRRLVWGAMSFRLAGLVDGFMSLSPTTRSRIVRRHWRLAGSPYGFFRHPAYSDILVDAMEAKRRREELGVGADQLLIGAVGMVGPYKGTEDLICAFKALKGQQYRLLIAGHPRTPSFAERTLRLAQDDPRVICKYQRLSNAEFARTTAACDMLAAPYRNYLHSGSLVYAASAQRRVITPATPFATDLAQVVGEEWCITYGGRLNQTVLRRALDAPLPAKPPRLSELSCTRAGESIRAFVEQLKAGRASAPPWGRLLMGQSMPRVAQSEMTETSVADPARGAS